MNESKHRKQDAVKYLNKLGIMTILCGLAGSAIAQIPVYDRPEARAAEAALLAVKKDDAPDKVYDAFNAFCKTHFGAESDPLIYERFGKDLKFIETGKWQHVSENSASLAWETNLPAVSYVEYGPTASYGQKSEVTDRSYFLHLHQLKGLKVGQTYHYRLVAVDERGNKLMSPPQTFETKAVDGAIRLKASADGSPLKLEKEGATYILTEDLKTAGAAIITLRDNITLDLNGYTITFGQDATTDKDCSAIVGRGAKGVSKLDYHSTALKVLNGTIRQGTGTLLAANKESLSFVPIAVTGQDTELAGLKIVTHAPQSWSVSFSHARGAIRVHHNVFQDMGANIVNRHGTAVKTIGFRLPKDSPNKFQIDHNLIQRARQNGFAHAHTTFANEIYVDSWSTNSFAIQPHSEPGIDAGEHYGNRIFATGFNPYGFGWAHENLKIHDNFISMFGLDTTHRWGERWGDVNMLAGVRLTNYGKGGQVRNNLEYYGNLIIVRGRKGSQMEGARFFSDNSVSGLVFRDNIVKAEALDSEVHLAAPIVVQGHYRKLDSKPVYYRNNRFFANQTIVQFGDSYGKGNNHHFENCEFIRIGDAPKFHTFVFGGGHFNMFHTIADSKFEGGAKLDDVFWDETASLSSYSVCWTLELQTAASAAVTIKNSVGEVAFEGTADAEGKLRVPLAQYVVRPMEWQASDSPDAMRAATDKAKHQKIEQTPHTVTATINGSPVSKTVKMDGPQKLEIR